MRLLGLVVTIFSACVLLLASAGPAAAATDVTCGQEITSPGLYTFSRDLVCTANEDIRISTGDVTIDLQGHTLTASDVVGAFNIFVFSAQAPVVIKNGTIRGVTGGSFSAAVSISAGSVVLQNLRITENINGVLMFSNSRVRVEHNLISSNGVGVWATPGSAAEVENNRIVHNRVGIAASQTWGGYFSNNFVALNDFGISVSDAAPIRNNLVVHNRNNGITLTGNQASFWEVTGNFAFGNGGYGIWAEFPVGISSGNRAAGNGSTPQCWNVVCSPSGR
jgi:nitrous oxidase accessory protein NosD